MFIFIVVEDVNIFGIFVILHSFFFFLFLLVSHLRLDQMSYDQVEG